MSHNQDNNSNSDILEVKVHPHLVGAVQKTTDKNGKVRVIPSTLVYMNDDPCQPESDKSITGQKHYYDICDKIAAIGLFSSRYVNVDELTRVNYKDDADNLLSSEIEGCETVGLYYPHNRITYHKSNEWLFECFQIQFFLEKELFSYRYLNLPTVVNIRRSSGVVQKGVLKSEDFIRFRKGSRDTEPQVYIRVYFSNDDPEETRIEECIYNKLIYLQDLVELNPEFTQLEFQKPKEILSHITIDEPVKEYVVNKIKQDYMSWIDQELILRLEKIKGLEIIMKD